MYTTQVSVYNSQRALQMVINTASNRKSDKEQCGDRGLGKCVGLKVLAVIYRLVKRM